MLHHRQGTRCAANNSDQRVGTGARHQMQITLPYRQTRQEWEADLDDLDCHVSQAQHHGPQSIVDGLGEELCDVQQQAPRMGPLLTLQAHQQLGRPCQPHPMGDLQEFAAK